MELSPSQICKELDRYIIGQASAKKAVAVALRNRYRRRMLPQEMRDEITPKNIIMKGPTGVGKTEIARRLAKLVKAPFVKVEATKFTEVGYVGRDVESMVRDLVEVSIRLVREEKIAEVSEKARETTINKIVSSIFPHKKKLNPEKNDELIKAEIREDILTGKLDNVTVDVDIEEAPKQIIGQIPGIGGNNNNLDEIFSQFAPKKTKKVKMTIPEAIKKLTEVEAMKMIDKDGINHEGLVRAEQEGIIFIDEIDKIASKGNRGGVDVSREGVQRDILPIVEGSTISTKYGNIKTDYILFIAAGAFQISSVSDLIPELQGRFPVFVSLDSLTEEDFCKILSEPDNAIIMQYAQMLKVDKVDLKFTDDAIKEIAKAAYLENENYENIGARRLHSVMEALLEDVSFNATGEEEKEVVIDSKFVDEHLGKVFELMNVKKYII
ncbi:MAG: ATP-dependent protease ATPase subunit HslU [Clostridia bacterium]|nr:ATP-dependent protease ATPase subunit HslU [Clostridia bacterium]